MKTNRQPRRKKLRTAVYTNSLVSDAALPAK